MDWFTALESFWTIGDWLTAFESFRTIGDGLAALKSGDGLPESGDDVDLLNGDLKRGWIPD